MAVGTRRSALGRPGVARGGALVAERRPCIAASDNVRFLVDNANVNLRLEDYKTVDSLLDHARRVEPNNQEIWAYYSVLWRLTDTDRYEWLNQYEEFIQQVELPFTESSQGYLETLKTYLLGLHTTSKDPLDQSVRNGTQSLDNLWRHKSPIVDKFRQSLDQSIKGYIGSLKGNVKE